MKLNIYSFLCSELAKNKKKIALLIDPDKYNPYLPSIAEEAGVDYIFAGGSILTNGNLQQCVQSLKAICNLPVILFPGNLGQISPDADAILFLSLISGRNADNLIGKHVLAAPILKKTALEIIPTGYMLIDGGKITAATYMSSTLPIPSDKYDIAMSTAIAGEMLGLKLIYMDAGSGALNPIPVAMIKEVKNNISIPLIVGGGIRNPETAYDLCVAGADVIVVGTVAEESPDILYEITKAVHCAVKEKSNYKE